MIMCAAALLMIYYKAVNYKTLLLQIVPQYQTD